ncbi:TerD family protein [Streptomyces tsukubensis]|uniref:TerD-family protein n=1 Tax=Streptomyces tsukubensis TaxID=83656 RepID=A0A1V4A4R3_9ACTN|nr:TerD family protein [Streptomyces tsukubensis]OON75189.1 TerD-family protein [Streptomyces tsukubensis]QFR98056.1 TerD-family protein [Streptomyces tsukubensis]
MTKGTPVNGLNKGIEKVEVSIRWDPSPLGTPATDLDLIAATYDTDDPYGEPVYVVDFESRSPDGTIALNRDSRTGQGLGFDEVMVLELNRLAESYGRVVVGVVIQQREVRKTFGDIEGPGMRLREGYDELATSDFSEVRDSTAATVCEFQRDTDGQWEFKRGVRGFDTDPTAFPSLMGAGPV